MSTLDWSQCPSVEVRILARTPDCGEIAPRRVHPFHDPDPRTERPLPVRMLFRWRLRGFRYQEQRSQIDIRDSVISS